MEHGLRSPLPPVRHSRQLNLRAQSGVPAPLNPCAGSISSRSRCYSLAGQIARTPPNWSCRWSFSTCCARLVPEIVESDFGRDVGRISAQPSHGAFGPRSRDERINRLVVSAPTTARHRMHYRPTGRGPGWDRAGSRIAAVTHQRATGQSRLPMKRVGPSRRRISTVHGGALAETCHGLPPLARHLPQAHVDAKIWC
jgi:hypothetical protein